LKKKKKKIKDLDLSGEDQWLIWLSTTVIEKKNSIIVETLPQILKY